MKTSWAHRLRSVHLNEFLSLTPLVLPNPRQSLHEIFIFLQFFLGLINPQRTGYIATLKRKKTFNIRSIRTVISLNLWERYYTSRTKITFSIYTKKKKTRENVFYSSTCWNTAFAKIRTILILLAKIWLKRSISPLLKLMGGKWCGLVPTRLNEGTNRWRLLYIFETCLENEVSRNDNAVKWTTWPTNGLNFSANTSESRQQQKKKNKTTYHRVIAFHCATAKDCLLAIELSLSGTGIGQNGKQTKLYS